MLNIPTQGYDLVGEKDRTPVSMCQEMKESLFL